MPLFASSNLPFFLEIAPVNAPFSWPKSSLSRMLSESAAQFTFINGLSFLFERSKIASAIISLPTPLSPVIRIDAFDFAIFITSSKIFALIGIFP